MKSYIVTMMLLIMLSMITYTKLIMKGSMKYMLPLIMFTMITVEPRDLDDHLPWPKGEEPVFTAYDCNEIKDYRLVKYKEGKGCLNQNELYQAVENMTVVVIQRSDHTEYQARRCSAKMSKTVYDCGWASFISSLQSRGTSSSTWMWKYQLKNAAEWYDSACI